MEINLSQITHAVTDALESGKKVEILSPVISGGYEELASFESVGTGIAEAKVKGMTWMRYLIPATSIVGFRLSERDDDE